MTSILKVSEIQDPTNSNTALSIDSSGVITYPQKIVWYANNKNAGGTYGVNNAYAKHAYAEVIVNHGNGYSGTNSRFTAPVAGTYFVTYSMHFRTGTDYKQAQLYKNGSGMGSDYGRQLFHRGGGSSSEQTLTANLYIDLAVNDYIEVYYYVTGGDIYYHDLNHFGGHFIG